MVRWSLPWTIYRSGRYELICRAVTQGGAKQPLEPSLSDCGYMTRFCQRHIVEVP